MEEVLQVFNIPPPDLMDFLLLINISEVKNSLSFKSPEAIRSFRYKERFVNNLFREINI